MGGMRLSHLKGPLAFIPVILVGALASGVAETVDFRKATPGSLPPNWLGTQTGHGQAK